MASGGGEALKRAVHVARAKTDITSDTQLSLRAGVSYDTLMNWFGGRTVPRGAELKKVADALGISYATLQAAYDGHDPEPPPLQDALRELVQEMRLSRAQQDEATLAILRALGAVVHPDPTQRETPNGNGHEVPDGTRSGRS